MRKISNQVNYKNPPNFETNPHGWYWEWSTQKNSSDNIDWISWRWQSMKKILFILVLSPFLTLYSFQTTLINHLLTENHGKKFAVIQNEFGEGKESWFWNSLLFESFLTNKNHIIWSCESRGSNDCWKKWRKDSRMVGTTQWLVHSKFAFSFLCNLCSLVLFL